MVYDFEIYRPSYYSRLYSHYYPVGQFIIDTDCDKFVVANNFFSLRLLRKELTEENKLKIFDRLVKQSFLSQFLSH